MGTLTEKMCVHGENAKKYSVLLTSILALVLFLYSCCIPWKLTKDLWTLPFFFIVQGTILLILSLQVPARRRIVSLVISMCAVVASYAFVYQDVGFDSSNPSDRSSLESHLSSGETKIKGTHSGLESGISYLDSMYFSLVTFTTLGYGDMHPKPDYRLLSATQALLGYIYLGLIVYSISALHKKSPPST